MKIKATLKKSILAKRLFQEYCYDFFRYLRYSGLFISSDQSDNRILISRIISQCHGIEKGLTMPEFKLGFGKLKLEKLIKDCLSYIEKNGTKNIQVQHAVSVILEYRKIHIESNYKLDHSLLDRIDFLGLKQEIIACEQIKISKQEYFENSKESFEKFANSRRSIRNYSEENISVETIKNAITIAINSPSSCNRQGVRTYVFTETKKINQILEIQGGNRGFGYLTNKLVLITSELGVSTGFVERNIGYVDGGMFAMNLLYALHFNEIGACPLNCNLSVKNDIKLRKLCGIKESEVFVLMISCGIVPESFKIALSKRFSIDDILTLK